jgi:hypothetical protein
MVGAKANIGTHIYPGSGHGRTSNRLCVRIVLSCTGMLVEGGYKQWERRGRSSKSLLA